MSNIIPGPVTPLIPAYVGPQFGFPLTPDTVPFTMRSGASFAEVFYAYKAHLDNTVLPTLNSDVASLVDGWKTTAQDIVDKVNEGNAEQAALITDRLEQQRVAVNNALAVQEAAIGQDIANLTTVVNNAVADIINSSITVSDPVIDGVLANEESESFKRINAMFNAPPWLVASAVQSNNIEKDVI